MNTFICLGQGINPISGKNRPNLAAIKANEQLTAQHQKLSIQQQLLKQQQNPNAHLATQENLLLFQLLNNEPSNRPLLLEQIRKQLSRQQANQITYQIHHEQSQPQLLQLQELSPLGLNGGTSVTAMNRDVPYHLLLQHLKQQLIEQQLHHQQLLKQRLHQLQKPQQLRYQQIPQIGLHSIPMINTELQQKLMLQQMQNQQLQLLQKQLNMMNPYSMSVELMNQYAPF